MGYHVPEKYVTQSVWDGKYVLDNDFMPVLFKDMRIDKSVQIQIHLREAHHVRRDGNSAHSRNSDRARITLFGILHAARQSQSNETAYQKFSCSHIFRI